MKVRESRESLLHKGERSPESSCFTKVRESRESLLHKGERVHRVIARIIIVDLIKSAVLLAHVYRSPSY